MSSPSSSSSPPRINLALNFTPSGNPIPNSQFSCIPLKFHFTNIHQTVDNFGIENLLGSYSSPSLQYRIHPQLMAEPVRFSHHLFNYLCCNLDLDDEGRSYLADTIARALPFQLPMCRVDAFVEIVRTEFCNGMRIDGGFVLNDINIEDVRPQYPYSVVDNGVMIFEDAGDRLLAVIERGRFNYGDKCEEESCAICFEKFRQGKTAVKMASCSHIFHENCILKWLERKNSCPLCRTTAY